MSGNTSSRQNEERRNDTKDSAAKRIARHIAAAIKRHARNITNGGASRIHGRSMLAGHKRRQLQQSPRRGKRCNRRWHKPMRSYYAIALEGAQGAQGMAGAPSTKFKFAREKTTKRQDSAVIAYRRLHGSRAIFVALRQAKANRI